MSDEDIIQSYVDALSASKARIEELEAWDKLYDGNITAAKARIAELEAALSSMSEHDHFTGCHGCSALLNKLMERDQRIAESEAALREIADQECQSPTHCQWIQEGKTESTSMCAVHIARRALDNTLNRKEGTQS